MQENSDYLQEWQQIVNANNLHHALVNHFLYLAETPEDRIVLESSMSKVVKVNLEKDKLIIWFQDIGEPLVAKPPLLNIQDDLPSEYIKLLSRHRTIKFYETLGENGDDHIAGYTDELETLGEAAKEFTQAKKLVYPIMEHSSPHCFIYHPFHKRSNGMPCIYLVIPHDPPSIESLKNEAAGSIFLQHIEHILSLAPYG